MGVVILDYLLGTRGATFDVDNNTRTSVRPPGFGALGYYSKGMATGLIVATGSANAVIWTLRWTDATRLCLIERVRVNAVVTGTITTAVPYDLELYYSRGYTVSPTTNIGTTGTLGSTSKRRTNMGNTLMGGVFILGTAAAGMTGATLGNDTDPLARISGATGTVIGTQFFGSNPADLWKSDGSAGQHPIVLAQNEGITIQAPVAGPGTGTFRVAVTVDWGELADYPD